MSRGKGKSAAGRGRRRIEVLQRVAAAVPVGYGLSYLFTATVPRILPLARTEAVLWTSMGAFALYLGLLMYAFAERSLIRLWALLGGLGAILVVLLVVTEP